jgi:hypothetical protein
VLERSGEDGVGGRPVIEQRVRFHGILLAQRIVPVPCGVPTAPRQASAGGGRSRWYR